MKTFFAFSILIASFLGLNHVFAEEVPGYYRINFPSSPNPLGSGARALGMGGAFIGVADDATAASWNPGGLIQIEKPEASFVGNWFHRIEDNTFSIYPEADGPDSISQEDINYFSISYPFALYNQIMVISLSYQHLYEFNRKWDFPITEETSEGSMAKNVNYQKTGSLSSLSLAYCTKFIIPQLSLGVTLNLWDNDLFNNEWNETLYEDGTLSLSGIDPVDITYIGTDRYVFSGFNYNIGLLWTNKRKGEKLLKIGLIFKSPFTADLEHKRTDKNFGNGDLTGETSYRWDEKLDMPMSYGIGFSYRFTDKLGASADIYRTEWQDFILTDSKGREWSLVTNKAPKESDIKATHQVRIGAEYLYYLKSKYTIPIRAGVFYDPAPAEGGYDEYYGFALGSGISKKYSQKDSLSNNIFEYDIDVAYQYRFGNNVGTSTAPLYGLSYDIEEHMIYLSCIIRFNK